MKLRSRLAVKISTWAIAMDRSNGAPDLPAASLRDLRAGLRDSEHIQQSESVIHKLMEDQGVKRTRFVSWRWLLGYAEALASKAIDAYFVVSLLRESRTGCSGKVLYYAKTSGLTSSPACWW